MDPCAPAFDSPLLELGFFALDFLDPAVGLGRVQLCVCRGHIFLRDHSRLSRVETTIACHNGNRNFLLRVSLIELGCLLLDHQREPSELIGEIVIHSLKRSQHEVDLAMGFLIFGLRDNCPLDGAFPLAPKRAGRA